MAEAEKLGPFDPETKPLWGVPFAVKDNIDVAGMPTTAACPAYSYLPDADAAVVEGLRAAGALVIGKTNLDQFATGLVGTRTPFPIPKNAVNPALIPGGSSSGSAVAVAQGIVSFALGTDTAGSGRIPAGLNGIVGLKPSLGALSTRGVVHACRSLDCVSIFTSTFGDAARVFQTARGYDPLDPFSRTFEDSRQPAPARRPRVGVPRLQDRRFFGDKAAENAYERYLADLDGRDVEVVEITFQPFYEVAELLYEGPWVAERYAAIEPFIEEKPEDLHPVTRSIIAKARDFSATDAFKGLYRLAELKRVTQKILETIDLLCVPTAPTWYTVPEVLGEPVITNSNLGTYTNFVNLLGLCGIVVPTGRQSDGRPASVNILGPDGADEFVAGFAGNLASGIKAEERQSSEAPMAPETADIIEIAVVGAHLSGLPLNHELLDLGAQYRRTTSTRRDYRLFELPGTMPPKPGLLRVAEGGGFPIEVEIWSMSPSAFGTFVSRIPSPLGIGALRLEDGTECKGFLVEAEATTGARDVSTYGGWRNFVRSQDAVA